MFPYLPGYRTGDILYVVSCAFVAGLARGFSGFGAALIFMPLVSSIIGPRVAAPLLLIIDAVAALGLLPSAVKKCEKANVGVMTVGGLIGVPLGAMLLTQVDQTLVRWLIDTVVALLLVLLVSGWRYNGRPSAIATIGVGAISGVFTGIAGAGGPPVIAYWLGGRVDGSIVRANIVAYFALATIIAIISYSVGGLFSWNLVPLIVVSGPLYAFGLYLGSRLFGMANERLFRGICFGLIALSAVISLPVLDSTLR